MIGGWFSAEWDLEVDYFNFDVLEGKKIASKEEKS